MTKDKFNCTAGASSSGLSVGRGVDSYKFPARVRILYLYKCL